MNDEDDTEVRPGDKSAVDLLIEEYGDAWPLEMVKMGHDDGGHTLDVFVVEHNAHDFRQLLPFRYQGYWTVVVGVAEGWGADLDIVPDAPAKA